ncbi:toll/interleukin-1 receptor domain-containing protein, partial [bacterium]|nr:toll/interleukin-1 receptor domain-containing protein [bacterium]
MANPEHVKIIKQGVEVWNKWREDNPDIRPDLQEADLAFIFILKGHHAGLNLKDANLVEANLEGVNFIDADISSADLLGANMEGANLLGADLLFANLTDVNLEGANLAETILYFTNLTCAKLKNANFSDSQLDQTIFADVNLNEAKNLYECFHNGPSSIDFRTLQKSGPLPRKFLRGVGLPDVFIDYYPSLFDNPPFQFYTCFISYFHEDQEFAERLHADLQDKGVRVWLDKHDMPIGGRIRKVIDQEIRTRDKVILVLSEKTVNSNWVEYEVDKTLDEEIRRKTDILMPIRLDDSVFDCEDNWAKRLSESRSIGDFTQWKQHDEYKKSFDFLMKWLKSEGKL